MGSTTWSEDRVVEAAHRMVRVRIDGKKHPNLFEQWKIKGTPTVIILDPSGKPVEEAIVGATKTKEQMAERLLTLATRLARPPAWAADLKSALEQAREAGCPVAMFWTNGQDAAEEAESRFGDADLNGVRAKVIWVRLKLTKKGNPDVARYAVTTAPTLLVLDPALEDPAASVKKRLEGAFTVAQVKAALEESLPPAPAR